MISKIISLFCLFSVTHYGYATEKNNPLYGCPLAGRLHIGAVAYPISPTISQRPSMYIYKITNLINNKCYVGQTTKSIKKRFYQHISMARCMSRCKNSVQVISKAIAKYGPENFKFEVVKFFDGITPEELTNQEIKYIKFYNTMGPNGYNMILGSPNGPKTIDTKKKISNTSHGRRLRHKESASKYIGVSVSKNGTFRASIRAFGYKRFARTFSSETEAAIAYDKMSLCLFGKSSFLNFPDKEYSQEELNKCYEFFSTKKHLIGKGKYFGVRFVKQTGKFQACFSKFRKIRRQNLGLFNTPEEAMQRVEEEYQKYGLIYSPVGENFNRKT